jgi:hypothetical protein
MKSKPIVLRIAAEDFDELFIAGEKMSNICFNLSQRESIPDNERASMKETQVEWDQAKSKVRRNQRT